MLKKSLIAIAVVALLAVSAQAGGPWGGGGALAPPVWVGDTFDLPGIPVVMTIEKMCVWDLGVDPEILLAPDLAVVGKYEGSITIQIMTNFEISIAAATSDPAFLGGDLSASVLPVTVPLNVDTPVVVTCTLTDADELLAGVLGAEVPVTTVVVTLTDESG